MKNNKGCIIHDGWSRFGRHYVALMAAYCITKQDANGKDFRKSFISLLACSTLPHDDSTSSGEFIRVYMRCPLLIVSNSARCLSLYLDTYGEAHATTFNADTHVKYINDTFENLGFDKVSDFALAQVADSTNLNPCIARKLDILHVACRNHCLNLACEDMEKDDIDLAELADATHESHRTIKLSNKLTAALANVQKLCYSMRCKWATRWNALTDMFNNHIKAEDDIRQVAKDFPGRLDDTTVGTAFMRRVKSHISYLNTIKATSCELQTKGATLSACNDVCTILDEEVQLGQGVTGDYFENCKLKGDKYLVGNKYDSGEYNFFHTQYTTPKLFFTHYWYCTH